MNIQKHPGLHFTIFSPLCLNIMDFFCKHNKLFFTPKTVSYSINKSYNSVRVCMQLLKRNQYLSKVDDNGSVYFISDNNLEFWTTDFRKHIIQIKENMEVKQYGLE